MTRLPSPRWLLGPALVLLAGASNPWEDASTQDLHGHARAASLDLRGVVPTRDEVEAIEAEGALSETLLDAWLDSEGFVDTVVGWHQARFWNNLSITLLNRRRLGRRSNIHFVGNRARLLRGVTQTHCGTFEATVNALNQPQVWVENEDGSRSEGWVWVAPFWDPETPIQVCAADAQLTEVTSSGADCATEAGHRDPECGCGPNLQWCFRNTEEQRIEAALAQDLDQRVRALMQDGAPYTALFEPGDWYVNGAAVHFFRHLAPFDEDTYGVPVALDALPDLDYRDDTWVAVPQEDHHDGVLTAPGWLLRHQTNRGRANRFYGAFLCSEFIPPNTTNDGLTGATVPTPDLQARAGCADCHARLEPWAAWWGRWAEAGNRYHDPDELPAFSEACELCATTGTPCPEVCEEHYLIDPGHPDELPYVGWLRTYAFLSGDAEQHPDEGPLGFVDYAEGTGGLHACAVETTAAELLAWETPDEALVDAWTEGFARHGDLRALVKAIVTSPAYWGGAQ